jgi:hypothetical protein
MESNAMPRVRVSSWFFVAVFLCAMDGMDGVAELKRKVERGDRGGDRADGGGDFDFDFERPNGGGGGGGGGDRGGGWWEFSSLVSVAEGKGKFARIC